MPERHIDASGGEQVADWIETTLLLRGTAQLGSDALYSLAKTVIDAGEAQVNIALTVMRRRAKVLRDNYPYLVLDVATRARPEASSYPYAALLLMSPGGVARQTVHKGSNSPMEVLFENLTAAACARMWGEAGDALRFGYPSEHGRPVAFPEAIAWLANKLDIQPGTGYRQPRRKDGGVDVVSWRAFPDGRTGLPLILVQCTLQSDLLSKANDVDVRLWSSWLSLDFDPMTALAVPGTISSNTPLWGELALKCLVLDRLRLGGLLSPEDSTMHGDWTNGTVTTLKDLMAGSF